MAIRDSYNQNLEINSSTPRRRIYIGRLIHGMSQSEFAMAAGISTRTFQRIEYGESPMSIELIFAAAKILNLSPGAFFASAVSENSISMAVAEKFAPGKREYNALFRNINKSYIGLKVLDVSLPSFTYNFQFISFSESARLEYGLHGKCYRWTEIVPADCLLLIFDQMIQLKGKLRLTHSHLTIEGTHVDAVNISQVENKRTEKMRVTGYVSNCSNYCKKHPIDLNRIRNDLVAKHGGEMEIFSISR